MISPDVSKIITSVSISVVMILVTSVQSSVFMPSFEIDPPKDEGTTQILKIKNNGMAQAQNVLVYIGATNEIYLEYYKCPEANNLPPPSEKSNSFNIEFSRISTHVTCDLIFQTNNENIKSIMITADNAPGFHWEKDEQWVKLIGNVFLTLGLMVGFLIFGAIAGYLTWDYYKKTKIKKERIMELKEQQRQILVKKNEIDQNIRKITNKIEKSQEEKSSYKQTINIKEIQKKKFEDILEEIKLKIENMDEELPTLPKIQINKLQSKYETGKVIKISGQVDTVKLGSTITIKIKDSVGNLVGKVQDTLETKEFSYDFMPEDSWQDKKYSVIIEVPYANTTVTKEEHFEFVAPETVEVEPEAYIPFDEAKPKVEVEPEKRRIKVQNTNFVVEYEGASLITLIDVDKEAKSLVIKFEKSSEQFTITLPRALIDAKVGVEDDVFFVLADGEEIIPEPQKSQYQAFRKLKIKLPKGCTELEIIGTDLPFTE